MLDTMRGAAGPDARLLTDANQNLGDWRNAASYMFELAEYEPMFIEEAIAYNDVPATRSCARRLPRRGSAWREESRRRTRSPSSNCIAGSGLTHCQIDGARVGGVNELFAIVAMAAKFGVPVCPHGGGIGLGQLVGPMAIFDQAWFGSEGRWLEYLEFLQQGVFRNPLVVRDGTISLRALRDGESRCTRSSSSDVDIRMVETRRIRRQPIGWRRRSRGLHRTSGFGRRKEVRTTEVEEFVSRFRCRRHSRVGGSDHKSAQGWVWTFRYASKRGTSLVFPLAFIETVRRISLDHASGPSAAAAPTRQHVKRQPIAYNRFK